MRSWRKALAAFPLVASLLAAAVAADPAMLVGYWTASGQGTECAALVHVLEPDGSLTILPFGLVSGEDEILRGRWRSEGGRVMLSFKGGVEVTWTAVKADRDHLTYTQDGLSIELERCADKAASRIGIGLRRLPPVPERP